ncbi:MAG: hypothetical protein H7296_03915 [Bacteroidia bacterium]|nr:hypothetical protein [Bacteroidia bacterium]
MQIKITTLNKILTVIIVFLFLTSCAKMTEKHYKSSDATTGGFMDVQLDLNTDKALLLICINQKEVSENDAGTTYKPDTLYVKGTWKISGDKICCEINESEEFIGDAFFKSNFQTKEISQKHHQIYFPISTDTIFIFGQPCIDTANTNR